MVRNDEKWDVMEVHYLLGQKHNLQMFRVIPFTKLQNDTYTTVKWLEMMKNEMKS